MSMIESGLFPHPMETAPAGAIETSVQGLLAEWDAAGLMVGKNTVKAPMMLAAARTIDQLGCAKVATQKLYDSLASLLDSIQEPERTSDQFEALMEQLAGGKP